MRRALILLACLWATEAGAQDADRGAWFESLKQPDTGMSCCSISDCAATKAEWRGGQWHAVVLGRMTPIPSEKIVRTPLSIDGDAYVCASPVGTIWCFVPPPQGF